MGFKALKILIAVEILLLFIQFWLGMYLNLFAEMPLNQDQNLSSYSGLEVSLHIAVGVSVLVFAGLILSYGSRFRRLQITVLSAFGLVFATLAPLAGATFLFKDQDHVLSMAMAASFLIAFALYLSLFYLIEKLQSQRHSEASID